MKKPVHLLFIVLLIAETCFGQKLQPIRPYLSPKGEPKINYSPRSMKIYIYENENYRETLFGQTGEYDVESMCQKFHVAKDTILLPGTYLNSGLNPTTGEYESFPGKYYRGDVTVYQNYENGYLKKILVYKDECANILNLKGYNNDSYVQVSRAPRIDVDLRSKPSASGRVEVENYVQPPKDNDDWSFRTPKNEPETRINLNLPPVEEPPDSPKKKLHLGWIIIPPAAIGLGIAAYFFLKNNLKSSSSDNGGHVTPPGHDDGGGHVTPPGHDDGP